MVPEREKAKRWEWPFKGVPPKPCVIKFGRCESQVCVPSEWTDRQIEEFANRVYPQPAGGGWGIRKNTRLMAAIPLRNLSSAPQGFVRVTLDEGTRTTRQLQFSLLAIFIFSSAICLELALLISEPWQLSVLGCLALPPTISGGIGYFIGRVPGLVVGVVFASVLEFCS